MAVMTSGTFAKALWPGVNKFWGKAYNEFPVEYTALFDTYTSRRRYEEDVGLSSFGLASVKEEGGSVSYDTEKQGLTTRYQHITYGLGFVVTREAMDDDLYDLVAARKAQSLAFSARQTKETVAANVYNRAFSSSYLGADNVCLANSAHVNVAGGTYSNVPTTDADISEAALEQATIDIMRFTNDRGLKINIMPDKIIVAPEQMYELHRILKAELRVGTSNNDPNALKAMGKFPGGVIVNHYLTDTDAWFIRTNCPDGMKHWVRRAPEFSIDNDWDTENAKFKYTERYSFGWTDPRGIYACQGA